MSLVPITVPQSFAYYTALMTGWYASFLMLRGAHEDYLWWEAGLVKQAVNSLTIFPC